MDCEDQVLVSIDRLNRRGWGIGSCISPSSAQPGKIEIIGSLPGDQLTVRLSRKRRGKRRGDLCNILKGSLLRVEPRCAHVPLCGGCTWQQMEYRAQLMEKKQRVQEIFAELIQHHQTQCRPILACEEPWQYRNKMEFSFSQNRAGERFLGLIIAGSRGHVFNLTECHLTSPWFSRLLGRVRDWWEQSRLTAYRMNDTGTLRTLTIREGKRTGDKLVMLTVSGNPAYSIPKTDLYRFIEAVKGSIPEIEWPRLSIFLRVQQIHKGSPTQFFEMHLYGPDHLLEKIDLKPIQLTFKISPTSFFQPNTFQAERLYAEALNMVTFPKRHVFDLYAGTATLGMAMAARAEKVTAIELNPHACFDAESNKELNQCANLEILCGDVGEKLAELQKRPGFIPPDLIIIDPPRAGLDPTALTHIQSLHPEEILYISCNPETQAANIKEMCSWGYRLDQMQPVDQFPHTPHIENIALLKGN
jgi:23S rRNA (uracil1939-C5)-methyltransferase